MSKQGYVYFAQMDPPRGPIKIGYSTCPEGRIAALTTGSPHPIVLVGVMLGTQKDERKLHRKFKSINTRGEWFQRTDELMQFIVNITKQEQPHAQKETEEPSPCVRDDGARGSSETERTGGRTGVLRRRGREKDRPRKTLPPSERLHLTGDELIRCFPLLDAFDELFDALDGKEYEFIDLARRAFATKVSGLIEREWQRQHGVTRCAAYDFGSRGRWPHPGDHGCAYQRNGEVEIAVADDYHLDLENMKWIVEMCQEHGLDVHVSAMDSSHFPGMTMRVEFTKREDKR